MENKELLLKETLELISKHNVTAYEIGNNLGIAVTGVKKIIDGVTKKPQLYTLNAITSYIKSKYENDTLISNSGYNKTLTNEEFISHIPEPITPINPPIKDLLAQAKRMKKSKNEPTSKVIENDELVDAIEYIVPIKGQAGLASKQYPDELVGELQKRLIRTKPEYRGIFYTIEVDGNSMPPKIQPKDWLRCEEISSMFWFENNFFKEKNIYCIWDNERGIIFKRIIYKDNVLWCSSDNEDKKNYPDFQLDLKTVSKILIVRKLIDRNI
ncbi:S24/S26 family peptidase [Chryseobacterium sp. KACC 21268]|nr:S24/S26 family peptidase [Chryseobacterium sp. KACC 21268]